MAWASILYALLVFLPAYVANMGPIFMAKIIPAWKAPIDGGRLGGNGKPILGPGKTWRGMLGGVLFGALTALVVSLLVPAYDSGGFFAGWDYGAKGFQGEPIGHVEPCADNAKCAGAPSSSPLGILLFGAVVGLFALIGDAVKSYFKRRVGKDRGRPWFPFDQLDFVVFGILGMVLAAPLLVDGWVWAALFHDWTVLATLLLLTPLLHYLTNVLGHRLRLKDVPW